MRRSTCHRSAELVPVLEVAEVEPPAGPDSETTDCRPWRNLMGAPSATEWRTLVADAALDRQQAAVQRQTADVERQQAEISREQRSED